MRQPAASATHPRPLAWILSLLLALPAAGRAAVVPYTFGTLVERSKWVVVAEVVELRASRAPFQGLGEVIVTDVVLRVLDVHKGDPAQRELTVRVLGGELGDEFQRCPESPRYERGSRVLVFARELNGALWTTGWIQGKYRIGADGATVEGAPGLPIAASRTLADVKAQVARLAAAPSVPLPRPAQTDSRGRP